MKLFATLLLFAVIESSAQTYPLIDSAARNEIGFTVDAILNRSLMDHLYDLRPITVAGSIMLRLDSAGACRCTFPDHMDSDLKEKFEAALRCGTNWGTSPRIAGRKFSVGKGVMATYDVNLTSSTRFIKTKKSKKSNVWTCEECDSEELVKITEDALTSGANGPTQQGKMQGYTVTNTYFHGVRAIDVRWQGAAK